MPEAHALGLLERHSRNAAVLGTDAERCLAGVMLVDVVSTWLQARGVPALWAGLLTGGAGLLALAVSAWLAHVVSQRLILGVLSRLIQRSTFAWDDALLRAGFFKRLSLFVPALVVGLFDNELFVNHALAQRALGAAVNIYVVVVSILTIDASLDAAVDLYGRGSATRRVPLKGFFQGAKLVTFLLGGVLILSLVLGRSPVYLLSGLGALTAVLLLVFKDALLGLVAGVQISVNRMVQIGDWIEMEKYGADGEVIDVGLTIVKVQNWDKTITTVPTYALISDPVKNWRGMLEAGGRRIKRAIYLDVDSFRFVDDELLRKFLTFRKLEAYLEQKIADIADWNERQGEDLAVLVNGRRLTNVGCFRAYADAYVRAHPLIHQQMTVLVRQLAASDKGVPIEIYAFVSDTRWVEYERVQGDLFDHLLTVLPEFGLRAFQSPSGHDARYVGAVLSGAEPVSAVAPVRARTGSSAAE